MRFFKDSEIIKEKTEHLTIDSVNFKYKNQNSLLSGVYLDVEKGNIIALFGRNGSGKTTLLNIIFGTLKTFSKNLVINNKNIEKAYTKDKIIAYMPQKSFVPMTLTVKKAIDLFLDKSKRGEIYFDDRINKILNSKIYNISGGEKRYLEFLLIMALDRHFVILDEPFSQIEPIYSKKMKEIIREHSRNKGIIITDHDYYSVLDVANKLILITQGKTKEIKNKDDLIKYGYLSK